MCIIYPNNHKKRLAVFARAGTAVGGGKQGCIHLKKKSIYLSIDRSIYLLSVYIV